MQKHWVGNLSEKWWSWHFLTFSSEFLKMCEAPPEISKTHFQAIFLVSGVFLTFELLLHGSVAISCQ